MRAFMKLCFGFWAQQLARACQASWRAATSGQLSRASIFSRPVSKNICVSRMTMGLDTPNKNGCGRRCVHTGFSVFDVMQMVHVCGL